MQITRAGEYAVLGMLNLARREHGQMAMIEEVSRQEQISQSFLAKIFQQLAKAGLVRSFRGVGGGFALNREASAVTVLEIIEAVEGPIALQRCQQEEESDCVHAEGCALCGLLEQAQDRMREVFRQTSLADLAKAPTKPSPGWMRRGAERPAAVTN